MALNPSMLSPIAAKRKERTEAERMFKLGYRAMGARAIEIVQKYIDTKPVGLSVGSKAVATIVVDTAQRIRRDLMTEIQNDE